MREGKEAPNGSDYDSDIMSSEELKAGSDKKTSTDAEKSPHNGSPSSTSAPKGRATSRRSLAEQDEKRKSKGRRISSSTPGAYSSDDDEKDITNNEMFDIEAQEQKQEPSRRASQVRFAMDTKPTKRTSM